MTSYPRIAITELCQIVGGGTPKRNVKEYFGGGIPWATPSDVTALDRPEIYCTESTLTESGLQNSSARLLPAGAVLLTSRATIGFTAVAQVPICTNQGFANFICGPRVLPEYLAAWLPTQRAEMLRLAGHTTFKEVSKSNLKRLTIPLPPLEEQRRIVDILNHAASIRRLRKQAKAKAQELIPALFLDMFGDPATNPKGWEVRPLGDVVAAFEGGRNLKSGPPASDGYRILKISAVTSGHFRPQENKPVPLGYVPSQNHIVRDGDFLFSRANTVELVGAVAIVCSPPDNLLLPDKVWRLRWKIPLAVQPRYMLAHFQNRSTRRLMGKLATGTSDSMRNISQGRLKKLRVPIPPLSEQEAFAERVADIQATIDQMDRAAKAAEQLQAALMARLFDGAGA